MADWIQASMLNRADVLNSTECGCYHCMSTFAPGSVEEWADHGLTAVCPECGVDSVVAGSVVNITPETLTEMNRQAFILPLPTS